MEQSTRVALYFDQISLGYRSRYAEKNPFHNFFFRQRLKAATDGFSFYCKSVLDIGAGTGALYEEICTRFPSVNYFGCDISKKMLDQSSIPADRRFVGKVHEIDLPRARFDFIFSLGVTTYQDKSEVEKTWTFLRDHLSPAGIAVISFTNRASIDHALRSILKLAKPILRRGIIGQSFATHAYRPDEVKDAARRSGMVVSRIACINQTFSPFNTLFPKASVAAAKAIDRRFSAPALSSDFIAFVQRKAD